MNPLIYLETSTSTNFDIQRFDLNEADFLGLYTFNQTQGKGQYNNSWEMSPGENLAFSFLLKADGFKASQSLLNFHTATVIRNFIANLTHENVEIKWPNDIILNKKKIGGLLIEKKKLGKDQIYIIGFGLNVLQNNFKNFPKAGSILTQCGQKHDLKAVAENLFDYLVAHILNTKNILAEFNKHLFMKNKVSVFNLNGIRQNGIIKEADESGFLWIDLENDGLKKFFHKEIELLY